MRWEKTVYIALVLGMSLTASAQVPVRPAPTPVPAKPRLEPCWQVAGIPKSVMDQRNLITRETHQQVETVCANTSLTPQQKQQEIKQIHQQEKQKMEGLITPDQQSAMRACQQERNPNPAPHVAHARTGPCGEPLPGHPSSSTPPGTGEQTPPEDTPNPN
jgi:hypothetical protein